MRSPEQRFRCGLLIAVLAVVVAAAGCLPPAPPTSPTGVAPGGAVLYGDSLIENARPYMRGDIAVAAFGGSSLCNWFDRMRQDEAGAHPHRVVLAFSGNMAPCEVGTRHDAYVNDIAYVRSVFPSAQVVFVIPPQFRDNPNDDVVQAITDSGVATVDGRTPLLEGGVYTDTLPCLSDETPGNGCDAAGRIVVRAADGVHFCAHGACFPPYASGARRYADAVNSAW